MRAAVIHNVRAGSSGKARAAALRRLIGGLARVACPDSLDELGDVVSGFCAEGVDHVAISGGDGTLHAVVTAMHRAYGAASAQMPTLELLRGGTMNTVADSLGLPRRRATLLARFSARVRQRVKGKGTATAERASLVCNGRVGFIFGIGVIPAFLEAYYATGRASPFTAARVLGRAVIESVTGGPLFERITQPIDFETRFDDGSAWQHGPGLALAAATITDIGLGFRPFHRAHEDASAIHCLRVDATPLELVRELGRIRAGRPMTASRARDRRTTGFAIHSTDPALAYVVDGEIYRADSSPLVVALGPTFRFVLA